MQKQRHQVGIQHKIKTRKNVNSYNSYNIYSQITAVLLIYQIQPREVLKKEVLHLQKTACLEFRLQHKTRKDSVIRHRQAFKVQFNQIGIFLVLLEVSLLLDNLRQVGLPPKTFRIKILLLMDSRQKTKQVLDKEELRTCL